MLDIEGGTPDIYTNPPEVYVDDAEVTIPLDPAFSVIDATTNPPFISALQLWSGDTGPGDTGPGDSGYWVLYGNDLADIWGATTASVDCLGVSTNITYASPAQVNIAFGIDGSVPVQTCNLSNWNPFGAGSIPVEVGFPFTPVQHNYPRNPLPNQCHIAQWFDKIGFNGTAHHAIDLVYPGCSQAHPELCPPYGTPVYAMEAGKVYAYRSDAGPANPGYPTCQGLGFPGNNLQIVGTDNYVTIYFHMLPLPQYRHRNVVVQAGALIGYTDGSGCQSRPHLHVGRKTSTTPVVFINFIIPGCDNSPTPKNQYDDGSGVDDDDDNNDPGDN